MRFRAKLSFMAFMRRMTIVELIVVTIRKVYEQLMESGTIAPYTPEQEEKHRRIFNKLNMGAIEGFTVNVAEFNDHRVSEQERQDIKEKRELLDNHKALAIYGTKNKDQQKPN